ncbi:hypothetical protein ABDK96_08785 [Citricoccus nitrophenolicus]|uniref:Secreted protein n=1 Tax=Citricoccus nitrophenolicus TaxID=863575 RepID=A0ABV0IHW9_9MICC
MSPDHSTKGVSRRTWRAAVVLFLVVFLGGLGLTSASALWSQQGTVQATVTTGSWNDVPQKGWRHPLNVYARLNGVDRHGNVGVRISWSPANPSPNDAKTRYTIDVRPLDGGSVHTRMPVDVGTARSKDLQVGMNSRYERNFKVTITPTLDGVSGEVTERALTVRSWSSYNSRSLSAKTSEGTGSADLEYSVEIR